MHYLLIYETAPDYLTGRAALRPAHLALAWEAAERGELLLAGAVGDPVDSAVLLFRCESEAIPKAFAEADPYVRNGLIARWKVQPWNTVVGEQAANPVRPA